MLARHIYVQYLSITNYFHRENGTQKHQHGAAGPEHFTQHHKESMTSPAVTTTAQCDNQRDNQRDHQHDL